MLYTTSQTRVQTNWAFVVGVGALRVGGAVSFSYSLKPKNSSLKPIIDQNIY